MFLPKGAEAKITPDDSAVVLLPSGSGRKPKGVVHSHGSVFANVEQIRSLVDLMPHDKIMMAAQLATPLG